MAAIILGQVLARPPGRASCRVPQGRLGPPPRLGLDAQHLAIHLEQARGADRWIDCSPKGSPPPLGSHPCATSR